MSISGERELGLKALGVHWNSETDQLSIFIPDFNESTPTKRTITSNVAKIYDSLCWISFAVVKVKILLQDVWKTRNEWDDRVEEPLLSR